MLLALGDPSQVVQLPLGCRRRNAFEHELSISADGVERCAQLMAHHRQEISLRLVRTLRFIERGIERGLEALLILDVGRAAEPLCDPPVRVARGVGANEVPAKITCCGREDAKFHIVWIAGVDRMLPALPRALDVVRVNDLRPSSPQQLGRLTTKALGGLSGDEVEEAVALSGPDLNGNGLGHRAESLLARSQRLG